MRLAFFFVVWSRHGAFERHVQVAHDAVAEVFEAVAGVVGVVVVRAAVDDQLVVTVYCVIKL